MTGIRILFTSLLLLVLEAHAQVLLPGSMNEEYYRLFISKNPKIDQPITNFPSIISDYETDSLEWNLWGEHFSPHCHKTFTLLSPQAGFLLNSNINRSYNDGPVWNGNGMNGSVWFGFTGKFALGKNTFFKYTVHPVIYYASNQPFGIPDSVTFHQRSQYAYPFEQGIDDVQRFGNDPVLQGHPGQSELKFVFRNLALGLTTENMHWGPAQSNPILLSNNGPGFPRLEIGSNVPISTAIGKIEIEHFWGRLQESSYFDSISTNNRRFITGVTVGYRPGFLKGVSFGAHRILYKTWSRNGLEPDDFIATFINNTKDYDTPTPIGLLNDVYDQMASFMIRWTYPEVGFEFYTEYARNDYPGNIFDFFRQPDRSRAYVLGFIQTFDFNNGNVFKITYENTTLSANQTQLVNSIGSPTYYTHHLVEQGFTHRGQIIGASIGPGSNTDLIRANYYDQKGMLGLQIQRIRFNDDYILNKFAGQGQYLGDFEMSIGINYQRFFDRLSINGTLIYSYRYRWYYIRFNDTPNFHFGLNLVYRLSGN